MGKGTSHIIRAFVSLATAGSLMCATAGCSTDSSTGTATTSPSATTAASTGHVALFLPSNSPNLSQNVPLNNWNTLNDSLENALSTDGFSGKSMNRETSGSLASQSDALKRYVQERLNADSKEQYGDPQTEQGATTIVIAPAVRLDRNYGEYSHFITTPNQEPSDQDASDTDSDESSSMRQIADSLNKAKSAGMHVVVLGNPIDGFVPNVYVPLVTAADIGRMQAQQIVSKLDLDAVSESNPKAIEVLLPNTDPSGKNNSFQAQAFEGIWEVLGPYFRQRKAYSPSQRLSFFTTKSDYKDVMFEATKDSQIQDELKSRLETKERDAAVRIDGILAMNDFTAAASIKALKTMGYSGSSMDVNPSITIFDVVGNIAGRKPLNRQRVPDPAQAGDEAAEPSQTTKTDSKQWPIITGFGAYISDIPNIVNGLQWMTGLVDVHANTGAIAQIALQLNRKEKLSNIAELKTSDDYGSEIPTLHMTLLAVSAANLKAALIDPGYISLADADM